MTLASLEASGSLGSKDEAGGLWALWGGVFRSPFALPTLKHSRSAVSSCCRAKAKGSLWSLAQATGEEERVRAGLLDNYLLIPNRAMRTVS